VHANARRKVPEALPLPLMPAGEVVLHDVFADETNGYVPVQDIVVGAGQARRAWLWIESQGETAVVDWLPGYAAYPARSGPPRLFTLAAGQLARYRANFRFAGACCSPSWYYEQWTIHIANAAPSVGLFTAPAGFSHDIDERVHLYGGRQRNSAKR
jgi:hypothetical protein